jgi:hypothetical protein
MKYLFLALMLVFGTVWAQDDEMENPQPPNDPSPTAASGPAPKITADPKAIVVTVNLTGSPLTGTCGYMTNLSWTASGASVCTKTGAWSGNAAASGSEQISVNSATATFTLTCSSNTDSRTLTWINPTQNTDGTNATLSGNKVYHAASAANIESANPVINLVPARTTYVLSGLPAGPRVVGVKATGSTGMDSAMSALASTSIVLPTGVDTVQATCTPPSEPKPPSGVTIAATVWDVMNDPRGGNRVGRDFGYIGLGVACVGTEAYIIQNDTIEYWKVALKDVTRYRKPRSAIVVARCELVTDG